MGCNGHTPVQALQELGRFQQAVGCLSLPEQDRAGESELSVQGSGSRLRGAGALEMPLADPPRALLLPAQGPLGVPTLLPVRPHKHQAPRCTDGETESQGLQKAV